MAARHWLTYIDLLKESATLDIDHIREEIRDAEHDLNAKTQAAQEKLARSRIARAKQRLAEAARQRHDLRLALLLDEED